MAVNKIPESQLPVRSVSDTDYVRIVGADDKSYRVPKTDFNGGGGGGTVDPSLSPTSTNPVQNKAIYSALNGLKDDLGDLSDLDTTVKTDLVSAINEVASGGGGALTQDTKQALLQCFAHTAWTDDQGQDYYDDLEDALYPFDLLSSISAVYTQSGTVYDTDSLDSLKADLVVTGNYSDGTYNQTTKYTLSGTLTVGTSTITVTYGGKTATFTVTVTQSAAVLTSISAVYTQSGTVYDTDSLDSLKTDLVVTAHYSDSSTATVASSDYTLSGTLTTGTSTVTVTYSGFTTTFSVTVTHNTREWTDGVPYSFSWVENKYISNQNGGESNYNGWNASPFLNCDGAGHLVIHNGYKASSGYNGWYDENQTWLNKFTVSSQSTAGATTSIAVPSSAVYFRVSYDTSGTSGDKTYVITPTEA